MVNMNLWFGPMKSMLALGRIESKDLMGGGERGMYIITPRRGTQQFTVGSQKLL